MTNESSPQIIVQPNVIEPVEEVARKTLLDFNKRELEFVANLESNEKKKS